MPVLSEFQIEKIKEHMLHDEDALQIKFKAKKTTFDTLKVLHGEVADYESKGWIVSKRLRTRTIITRSKDFSRQLEDDIWCMFYNLGFRVLNADDKLIVPWGPNDQDKKQLDVVAVGNDAIFVVECKAAEKRRQTTFQQTIIEMATYMGGVSESLRQIYGKDKRVKFIFATRNYHIVEGGEDEQRLKNNDIYHMDENAFKYVENLINSYQSSASYQFYGLMFKDELISDQDIIIPALQGKMGEKTYYLFSIEPSTLLKIGFVLHRTKVNDASTPTYQRLLVPKRLKGITSFINDGGYFPNSIIINFDKTKTNKHLTFDPIHKENDSDSQFGLLHIPNAYGIAYIIDGQHRVYGYANSSKKDQHTIPVVAFADMPFEEQLEIFMQINENQKAVSKNLRIDLEQDLFWTSDRLDSRMKALRSATIKELCCQPGTVLYNMISIGEDNASLSSINFEHALSQSLLIPKAKQSLWIGDTDVCLYNVRETNVEKAMNDAKSKIAKYILACYDFADEKLKEDIRKDFLLSNRATFAFVTLMGLLHAYLCQCGKINQASSIEDCIGAVKPYIEALASGLNNISNEDSTYLRGIQGQGAESKWLLAYQNIINLYDNEYFPEELQQWRETRDQSLQEEGEVIKNDILKLLKNLVFDKLKEVYGDKWERNIATQKHECEGKILKLHGEDDDYESQEYDWRDWLDITDYKTIISNNFTHDIFTDTFSINILNNNFKSKTDKLAWLNLLETGRRNRTVALTKSDINRLDLIRTHLLQFVDL